MFSLKKFQKLRCSPARLFLTPTLIEFTDHVDSLAINLCSILENKEVYCVPIPSEDPYEYWDQKNMKGREFYH
ncbi:hypothetical protein [Methanobacterium alcaliphilum]|uniref:hypothetical protein n=1 Tax=Methanobacterium alcaliphilum TaxID=392018 RepID=UPI00200B42D6|nr:hypothetical protein [Methanobacterium alcaliphilum]MCK9152107.1 hypothetical protein [Methanobacterium alcaliphilum]